MTYYSKGEKVDRSNLLWGIDVSSWQDEVDFFRLHANKCSFVFVKALQGVAGEDADFRKRVSEYVAYVHWCLLRDEQPMKIGVYAFVLPDSDVGDAEAEANSIVAKHQLLVNAVEDAIANAEQHTRNFATSYVKASNTVLPVTLDLELWPPKLVGRDLREWIATWLRIVEHKTGLSVINYTNASYLESVGAKGFLAGRALWVAFYDRAIDNNTPLWPSEKKADSPRLPSGYACWWFWQPDAHAIEGVANAYGKPTRCDINYFNGCTDLDLEKFIELQRMVNT